MNEVGASYLVPELKDVCFKFQAAPSCVFQQIPPLPPKVLSYSSLWKSLRLHQVWLQNTIQRAAHGLGWNHVEAGTHGIAPESVNVVVAYLSTNSVDMLLSVLACTSSTLCAQPSLETMPALLNTRWTPTEIVDALQPAQLSSSMRFVTILLCDDAMEGLSHQVFQDWKTRHRDTLAGVHHQFFRLHLPIFSLVYLQTPSWLRNRDNPQQVSDPDVSGLSPERPQEQLSRRLLRAQTMGSETDAIILFTSGTTGGSKGVRLSHRALLVQALAKLEYPCSYCGDTAILASTVPIFHVGGLSSFLAVLLAGGRLVFPTRSYEIPLKSSEDENRISPPDLSYSFQVRDLTTALQDPSLPANTLVVVPVMLSLFFSSRKTDESHNNHLSPFPKTRLVLIGGQSAPPDMLEMIKETFPRAHIVQTYACTEAASSLTFLSLMEGGSTCSAMADRNYSTRKTPSSRPIGDCVGHPPAHVKLRLYPQTTSITGLSSPLSNLRSMNVHPIQEPYQVGVIATSGSHIMNGYWQRGKRNVQRVSSNTDYDRDGSDPKWYVSSDLGFWDEDGRLYFSGRVKDVIRTGGETVMAQEVERVILLHPAVSECAVFARKDERFGEAVACAIVFVVGMEGTLGIMSMKKWCQTHGLARYKCPKYLYTVDSLPRNSSGKILKQELVAQFESHPGRLQSRL